MSEWERTFIETAVSRYTQRYFVGRIQVLLVLPVTDDLSTISSYLLLVILLSSFFHKALLLTVPTNDTETLNCSMKWQNQKHKMTERGEKGLKSSSECLNFYHFIICLCWFSRSPSSPMMSRTAEEACCSKAVPSPPRLNLTPHRTPVTRLNTQMIHFKSYLMSFFFSRPHPLSELKSLGL